MIMVQKQEVEYLVHAIRKPTQLVIGLNSIIPPQISRRFYLNWVVESQCSRVLLEDSSLDNLSHPWIQAHQDLVLLKGVS